MLGSVSEAEDVVQEALLRLHRALDSGEQIASPRAFRASPSDRSRSTAARERSFATHKSG
jgi:DNA-directed RNA polymerase specialized sigma24 family protein